MAKGDKAMGDDTQGAAIGDDTVVSGEGADTVVADAGVDSVAASGGDDTVTHTQGGVPATATDDTDAVTIDHRLGDALSIQGTHGQPLSLLPGPGFDDLINRANMIPHPMTSVPTPEGLVHRDWIHRVVDLWLDNREPNPGDSWLAKAD